jgi:predicted ArsR family transcriptional regulator
MAKRKQRYVIQDPKQVNALTSPFRHHLIRTLSSIGPATVRELAEALDRSAESLYYHLRALERVGLVLNKNESPTENCDAVYDTPARLILTDPKASDRPYLKAYHKSASALLRLADRQFGRAIDHQIEERKTRSISLRIQQLNVRLAPSAQRELAAKMDELLTFLTENDQGAGSDSIAVTLVSCPIRSDE